MNMDKKKEYTHKGKDAASRPLTRKQAAFVRYLLEHPEHSATRAIMATYGASSPVSPLTAAAMASENLRKPNIMAVLANHDLEAQKTLAMGLQATRTVYGRDGKVIATEADYGVRIRAADSILDRIHGKATQRTESTSAVVEIKLDLTGE